MESEIKNKDAIGLAVDIRNSTNLYIIAGHEKTAEIISNFIEKVYVKLKSYLGLYNYFIFGGDGLIAISYVNDNKKAFNKSFDSAIDVKEIIKNYEEQYVDYNFTAGIGISFSNILIKKIKNMDTKWNNRLFVGKSVSYSTKLCSSMPLQNDIYVNKRYIGMDKDYFKKLDDKNKKKCSWTRIKYIENEDE